MGEPRRRPMIDYIIRIRTGVIHQQDEGSCVDITLADMTTIIYRLNGGDPNTSYDLTPQIGIDRDRGIGFSIQMCTKPEYGLEKTNVYPYSKLPRNIDNKEDWKEEWYQTPPEERYRLKRIMWFTQKEIIEKRVLRMFGVIGFHYPIVGIMYMGRFADPAVARQHALGGPPFRHGRRAVRSGVRHALLIVGLNTMSNNEDDHFCVVKNSHGDEWGEGGYSRVGIEVFEEILYPIQPRSTVKKREKRKRGDMSEAPGFTSVESKTPVSFSGTAKDVKVGPLLGLTEIGESQHAYIFQVSLPGTCKVKLDVRNDGKVMIKGVVQDSEFLTNQCSNNYKPKVQQLALSGNFTISFNLPGPVDPRLVSPTRGNTGVLEVIVMKNKTLTVQPNNDLYVI